MRRFSETIKHGVLKGWKLEETIFQFKLHLVNLPMIFVRRWLKLEQNLDVLNHVSGVTKKINAVNYLTRNQPLVEECYYKDGTYVVNDQTGGGRGFGPTPKVPVQIIGAKVKESKIRIMEIIIDRVNMFGTGITIVTTTTTGITIATETIVLGLTFLL